MKRIFLTLALSFALAACGGDAEEGAPESDNRASQGEETPATRGSAPHPGGDPVPMDRLGNIDLSPDRPEPEVGVRNRMRMDLDQLDQAMINATGFQWTDGEDGPPMFNQLASTLGKPNFVENTLEDLSPSLLFHKFLDDGARFVCTKLMQAEQERSADERTFLLNVDPAAPFEDSNAIDISLANALLRFHGRKVSADSPELDVWRWLLENTPTSDEKPLVAWTNVCTGLITHPDFYAY